MDTFSLTTLRSELYDELIGHILPFHAQHGINWEKKTFNGYVANDLSRDPDAPICLIQVARMMWSYARAYRAFGDGAHRDVARFSYDFLQTHLHDGVNGGYVWMVDSDHQVKAAEKMVYGQAFTIYGLAELGMADDVPDAHTDALHLFHILNEQITGGCPEAFTAAWLPKPDMYVDDHITIPITHSMNTHLHVIEAYAHLVRATGNDAVRTELVRLIDLVCNKLYDGAERAFIPFTDGVWQPLNDTISYGHDIETSWLLWDAAVAVDDGALLDRVRPIILDVACAVYENGLDEDGAILNTNDSSDKIWWAQMEGVVGFFNAWQLTGNRMYLDVIDPLWAFTKAHIIDHERGGWYWGREVDGRIIDREKTGAWKTPYHDGRACIEVIERLNVLERITNMNLSQLVDVNATKETCALFDYLRGVRGKAMLFGTQHPTSYGIFVPEPDGVQSDLYNSIGKHPAIFGWDTLVLDGWELPGRRLANDAENVAALVDYAQKAHQLGGIVTLSTHPHNFVTGNDFYDVTGDVVCAILPDGAYNDAFNDYLDRIARFAHDVKDDEGNRIPIIFRPFHENNGDWFWWGAPYTEAADYIALFRYVVTYLRDRKNVHNLLYAYSPNGAFDGVPDGYMQTYPGDAYVDVLGYDHYDPTGGAAEWLDTTVQDLAMIADIADKKGKVSAFTEVGMRGMLGDFNNTVNLNWFTDVLNAIKADGRARRSVYMQTWANFGESFGEMQYYIPYPGHRMVANLQAFADDPFTHFASDRIN